MVDPCFARSSNPQLQFGFRRCSFSASPAFFSLDKAVRCQLLPKEFLNLVPIFI